MMAAAQKPQKPLARWQWWGIFLLATYVMSLWFEASRAFFAAPGLDSALALGGAMLLLILVMSVLMYDSYVKERTAGKVIHPIRPFEWLYKRQYGDDSGGSDHE